MPEEAAQITEENVDTIADKYDVDPAVLDNRIGWFFVGEVDCDYWYAILSPGGFASRYQFKNEDNITSLTPVSRRVLSLS